MYSEKYQWVKGEKAGTVETYSSHDGEWVYFIGGARIGVNVINEFMIQVDANTPVMEVKPEDHIGKPVNRAPEIQLSKKEDFNPVKALLKQSSKNKQQFTYRFDLDIPKVPVYNLIGESFDVDLDEMIVDMLMSTVDRNLLYKNVREQLKEQILKIYNNGNKPTRESED
jgi:hypothetical protein